MICKKCGLVSDKDALNWSAVSDKGVRYESCPLHHTEVYRMFIEENELQTVGGVHLTEIVTEPFLVRCCMCAKSAWVDKDNVVEEWLLVEDTEDEEWYCPDCERK